ncbi:hypothetical protein [Gramella sp. MAR_2010_147]|uniref:hypothetical protein n=1 Tax=Gramella sp. MAR_2010_147 TaxID=1250205 RepID=UPI00087BED93|nr:hypothetical protein [Gramella sp. MAR_2010_147]SDR91317.1 hypothetical protein SAMN04488553_1015 [Gramella sp. MAR_2010_147]
MKSLESTDIVITNGIKTWWTYPIMMKWKKIQRDKLDPKTKDNIISGINSSLIVDCTCFLEGIFDLAIREKINYQKDGNYKHRINDHLLDRLENAQFNEYQKLYYLAFGNELKDVTDNQKWKAIKSLFSFRNLIVHGSGVLIDYYRVKEKFQVVGWGKYNSIINYLIEIKLVPKFVKNENTEIDIFESRIADYYYAKTLEFTNQFAVEIQSKLLQNEAEEIIEAIEFNDELEN